MRLFSIFGLDVRVDLGWLVIALLMVWSLTVGIFPRQVPGLTVSGYLVMAVLATLGLSLSIVLHELGHALVARRSGLQTDGITLFVLGGLAQLREEPRRPGEEAAVAIAGPVVSLVLGAAALGGGAVLAALEAPSQLQAVVQWLGLLNACLALFNLIPAFPLDGGRLLRALLWRVHRDQRRATAGAAFVSVGFGLGLATLGVMQVVLTGELGGLWWVALGLFIRSAARGGERQLRLRGVLAGQPVLRFVQLDHVVIRGDATVAEALERLVYARRARLLAVVDREGWLQGYLTAADLATVPRAERPDRTVLPLTHPCAGPTAAVPPDSDAAAMLGALAAAPEQRLLVAEPRSGGQRLVGVVTLQDLVQGAELDLELEEEQERRQRAWAQRSTAGEAADDAEAEGHEESAGAGREDPAGHHARTR